MADLSIIIVNYNVYGHLIECIRSIKNNLSDTDYEIIVVDNNSTDRSIDNLVKLFPDVNLYKMDRNIGFGAANNFAVKHASGKYLLLINPDIAAQEGCIKKLLTFIQNNNDVGVVAPALYRPSGEYDYYNSFFPSMYSILMLQLSLYNTARGMKRRTFDFFDENMSRGTPFRVEQAMGACILIGRSLFEDLGGFDEAFFLYQEETDLEYRMTLRGLKVMILPAAKAIHDHHSSTNNLGKIFVGFHWLRSIMIFYIKHYNIFKRTLLRSTMFVTLVLREIKYLFIYLFKPKILLSVSNYTFKLVMLNLMFRKSVLKSRFTFEKNG